MTVTSSVNGSQGGGGCEADMERNDSVGSDSCLLKDSDNILKEEEEEAEDDGSYCEQPEVQYNAERQSKRTRTVFLVIFAVVVILFVVAAITTAVIFTIKSPRGSKRSGEMGSQSEKQTPRDDGITVTTTTVETESKANTLQPTPVVRLSLSGKNCSEFVVGSMEQNVFSFKGMRYSQPPVGALRWKPPKPFHSESSACVTEYSESAVHVAKEFGSRCVQRGSSDGAVFGDEDCLYINVWTPSLDVEEGLDVMVYVHGGGLITGSGQDFDSHLISRLVRDHRLVVVTFNYRLNAFGFLALDILSSNANETGHFR